MKFLFLVAYYLFITWTRRPNQWNLWKTSDMNTAQLAYRPLSRHTVRHFYNMGYACQPSWMAGKLYNFSPLENEIYFRAKKKKVLLFLPCKPSILRSSLNNFWLTTRDHHLTPDGMEDCPIGHSPVMWVFRCENQTGNCGKHIFSYCAWSWKCLIEK